MKLLILLIIFLTFSVSINAQCTDLEDCNNLLSIANQRINKLLEVSRADKKVIEAQDATIKAKNEALAAKDDALLAKDAAILSKNETIEAKNDRIESLEAIKCSRASVLFFLVKFKRCN